MITISELTKEDDLANGFRGFLITSEDRAARTSITISVRREENLALYDEAPSFSVLPFSVETNHSLAMHLLKLAGSLLERRHQNCIPPTEIILPDEPVPFAIIEKPNCHEG